MKKYLFIATITLLTFSSCKNEENTKNNASTMSDSIVQQGTTSITIDNLANDSTSVNSTDVKLLNKMSTKTTTKETDLSKGKYALSETKWKLLELNGKSVKSNNGKDYFINLDSKSGKFAGYAGCSSISGSYVMKAETKLAFSKIISTKMACSNLDFEISFIKTLGAVDNYMIEGDGKILHLHKAKNSTLAKFEAVR